MAIFLSFPLPPFPPFPILVFSPVVNEPHFVTLPYGCISQSLLTRDSQRSGSLSRPFCRGQNRCTLRPTAWKFTKSKKCPISIFSAFYLVTKHLTSPIIAYYPVVGPTQSSQAQPHLLYYTILHYPVIFPNPLSSPLRASPLLTAPYLPADPPTNLRKPHLHMHPS